MSAIDNDDIIALCNQSLSMLGAKSISNGGSGTNYNLCLQFYADARDEILVGHPWNDVIKRSNMIQTTDPLHGYDYAFSKPSDCLRILDIDNDTLIQFVVEDGNVLTNECEDPTDWEDGEDYIVGDVVSNDDVTYTCLVAHTAGDADDEPGVGADTGTYWNDEGDDYYYMPVRYIYQRTDIENFKPHLYQCIVYELALKLSSAIKKNPKAGLEIQQALFGGPKVLGYLNWAASIDAQESAGATVRTKTWLDVRTS